VSETLKINNLVAEAQVETKQDTLAPAETTKTKAPERRYTLEKSNQAVLEAKEDADELALKIHGVIDKTYIVAEDNDGMLLIDQHAMHERILYEKFMKELMQKKISTQQLISPLMLELSPEELAVVRAQTETFTQLGFEIEDFGDKTIVIRTMPVIFGRQQDKEIVQDVISELKKHKLKKFDEIKEEIITRMACRAAIKAGDDIPTPRLRELLAWFMKHDLYTCPHGRPAIIKFPISELEKRFKRVV